MIRNPDSPDLRIQLARLNAENKLLTEIVEQVLADLAGMSERIRVLTSQIKELHD